jgi:hypothetical protein
MVTKLSHDFRLFHVYDLAMSQYVLVAAIASTWAISFYFILKDD